MLLKGNKVVCTDESKTDIYNQELEVVYPHGNPDYNEWVGEHIIAMSLGGKTHVLKTSQYKPLKQQFMKKETFEKFDRVRPLERDRGTQKPFYYVAEVEESGIAFFDDNDYKRYFPYGSFERVKPDDVLDMIAHMSSYQVKMKKEFDKALNGIKESVEQAVDL